MSKDKLQSIKIGIARTFSIKQFEPCRMEIIEKEIVGTPEDPITQEKLILEQVKMSNLLATAFEVVVATGFKANPTLIAKCVDIVRKESK
jgi:hypothetical protein